MDGLEALQRAWPREAALPPALRARLGACLAEARLLLAPETGSPPILRPPKPGEHGWVIARHGALYAEEFGWDGSFEAAVAEIVAGLLARPEGTQGWIAEVDGVPVGSVFLVPQSPEVAKLRLLLVEPTARGRGVGRSLVEACIAEARARGHQTLTLWTNDVLTAARRLYATLGFRLTHAEPRPAFGVPLVSETWELGLSGRRGG